MNRIETITHPSHAAEGVERSDVEAVNSAAARSLYQARVPIFPKLVHGRFRALKWAAMIVLLAVYYGVPWIRWPRGIGAPDQAVLVDMERSRFYFFFIELWPQELYFLTGLLILAALGLFLVTSLFGRVWCGYACPQTVWTDLYIAVERLVEGDRAARMRLAKAPWGQAKILKKATKHALWLLIAMATGGAWILYFHDAPSLAVGLVTGDAPGSAYLFLGLLTFTTYALAGSMREQVCTYMCPWPRIQAALTDADALNVTYRTDRGEPRGAHKKGDTWEGRGDCIDCKQCVAACPMGIDIRDGAQLECIHCALCIDACDEIMKKIDRPKGLIAYDTDANIERRARGDQAQVKLIRPRVLFYFAMIGAVSLVLLLGLTTRASFEVNVLRDRNPSFVRLSDGSIRNGYTLKLINREGVERSFAVSIDGLDGLAAKSVGLDIEGSEFDVLVGPSDVRSLKVYVTVPTASLTAGQSVEQIVFGVSEPASGETHNNPNVFMSGN